jgi:phosphopantothenoylcysteine synthetase/decarboxylase
VSIIVLVVSGAPLARRALDLATALQADGWQVQVVATPASSMWLGQEKQDAFTTLGSPVRFDFRSPAASHSTADPDAVAVCPASFNTINKVAAGIADTYATALICESLGLTTPMVIVPMINRKLWGHPRLSSSLALLRDAGVTLLDVQTGGTDPSPVESGTGDAVVDRFDPRWLTAAVRSRT